MAPRIYDTGGGYTPARTNYQPTIEVPAFNSPALRAYVEEESGRLEQDIDTTQKNVAKFQALKDEATGMEFLSPANQQRFETLRKQRYNIDDDFGKMRAQDFKNPYAMSAMEQNVDKLFKDPEVKRLLESEIAGETFRRNYLQIQDPELKQKAEADYEQALQQGEDALYGLNAEEYAPVDVRDRTYEAIKGLPQEQRIIEKDGYQYPVRVPRGGEKRVQEEIIRLYNTDPQFRNNFEAKMKGSGYDSIEEYAQQMSKGDWYMDEAGQPKKIKDDDKTSSERTLADYEDGATPLQKAAVNAIANELGIGKDEAASTDLVDRVYGQLAGRTDEFYDREGNIEYEKINAAVKDEVAAWEEEKSPPKTGTERMEQEGIVNPAWVDDIELEEGEEPTGSVTDKATAIVEEIATSVIDTAETNDEVARQAGFDSVYDVPYAYGEYVTLPEDRGLTDLTLDEISELQLEQIERTKPLENVGGGTDKGTGAMGRYQITYGTLNSLRDKLGLSGDTRFSKEVQDRMFTELVKGRGLDKYLKGELSVEEFIKDLQQEWEGLKNIDKEQLKKNLEAKKRAEGTTPQKQNPLDKIKFN